MDTKKCTSCQKYKPIGLFNKNGQQSDGLTVYCKSCLSALRKKWDKKYSASGKARATSRRYYYSEKGRATKSAYRKAYVITPEQAKKYREAAKRHEKEPKYQARVKRYRATEKGRETKARQDKKYAKTESGRFTKRKIEIKRSRQLKADECTITAGEWMAIKRKYANKCAYCGKTPATLEMDHVHPLSRGGKHTAENVVPACRTCNAKKGAKIDYPPDSQP